MSKNKVFTAYLGMILYAIIVGFSFIFVKTADEYASVPQVMTYRFAVALLPHIILLLTKAEKVNLRLLKNPGLLLTSLTFVGFLGFQAWGLLYTTSIISGILFAMTPVFAQLIARIVLKEKTTWIQNLFLLLSVGAIIALSVVGSSDALDGLDWRGLILLLLATICCSARNVMMRYIKQEHSTMEVNFYCSFTGFALFFVLLLISTAVNHSWQTVLLPLTERNFLIAIFYLGIFCTFILGNLVSYSLQHLNTVNATIWGNLSTAISVVAGPIILNESISFYQIICAILIIIGALGISFFGKKQ